MSGFSINHVVLSGNLTRDPELRHTGGGTPVCHMRIANNIRKKDQASGEWGDTPHYFDVTVWGGIGEHLAGQLSKGDRIVVDGRIEWREWTAEGGGKRQAYDVIADGVVTFGDGGGGGQQYRSDVPADTADMAPPAAAPAGSGGAGSPDDDIPF